MAEWDPPAEELYDDTVPPLFHMARGGRHPDELLDLPEPLLQGPPARSGMLI
ncbi:hypothetical protein [Streptomyces sp. NBC_00078]|uniref:hypothetical protein n=1 Tax=unclassified Streptomyces TaxID=2593676 RepID=UPI0022531862|nr:hypothetical protein [Streptomyces sp. NBC_00078]MCX5424363.1 hypothetical protein [Streptomyces sp. NBC_00078]